MPPPVSYPSRRLQSPSWEWTRTSVHHGSGGRRLESPVPSGGGSGGLSQRSTILQWSLVSGRRLAAQAFLKAGSSTGRGMRSGQESSGHKSETSQGRDDVNMESSAAALAAEVQVTTSSHVAPIVIAIGAFVPARAATLHSPASAQLVAQLAAVGNRESQSSPQSQPLSATQVTPLKPQPSAASQSPWSVETTLHEALPPTAMGPCSPTWPAAPTLAGLSAVPTPAASLPVGAPEELPATPAPAEPSAVWGPVASGGDETWPPQPTNSQAIGKKYYPR